MKSETPAAKAVEKTLHGKVPKRTFPRSLEIPQTTRDSHFSHSLDCYWVLFALWTHWLRPKPAKMAPFFTVADSERRKEMLRGEQVRLRNQMERLITAYQDGLLTLEQLRERMPNLKQQSQAANSELQLLEMAKLDQAKYLKLAESLGGFRKKLRARAQMLEVKERQQILRLLVKEILVGFDTLTIRHSIPIPSGDGPPPNDSG